MSAFAKPSRSVLVLGLSAVLAGCGGRRVEEVEAPPPEPVAIEPAPVEPDPMPRGWTDPSQLTADGPVLVGPQPDAAGLTRFATSGGTLVIDLRTDAEHEFEVGFDEGALTEAVGLRYERIPVEAAEFGAEEVLRLAEVVSLARGGVLVHCSTGNRAAGLWAAYLVLVQGETPDTAIEVARVMGLSRASTEERVRELARAAGR